MAAAATLGLDALVEAHDGDRARPAERPRRRPDRDQRPRSLDVPDRPRTRSSTSSPKRLCNSLLQSRKGWSLPRAAIESRAQAAAAELAGADAVLVGSALMRARRSGGEAPRADRPAARQGLRAHARGGRGRSRRGGRRPRRVHPRAPRARAGRPRARRARDDALGRGASSASCRTPAPTSSSSTSARTAIAAAMPSSCAAASRSQACSTCPGSRTTRAPRARGRGRGPHRPRGRARAGERARCDRGSPPVGGRRELAARDLARHQGPRPDPRVRRGGALMSVGALRRSTEAATCPRRSSRPWTNWPWPGCQRGRTSPFHDRSSTSLLRTYAGRPTPLTLAERFAPGKRLYLKREDLLHTGAHKLNNALGQVLLATAARQAADRRRDGRGPARRRGRDRLCALRPRVRRLHGRRGHAPPAAERRAHAPARRRGPAGRVRNEDA